MSRFPGVLALVLSTATAAPGAPGPGDGELPPVGSAGGPSRPLAWAERARWRAGRALFERAYAARDGLGAPGFNAARCATCHALPVLGGAGGREFDVVTPRGATAYAPGRFPGDALARMRELREDVEARVATRTRRGDDDGASPEERVAELLDVRQTPSLLGLGLVDTIPDAEILVNADPDDRDGDGVRGVASRITVRGAEELGRFGWKADVPRLSDFVCRALGGELGLTAPEQGRGFGLAEDGDAALDPETTQAALDDLAFFVAHLAPPPRDRKPAAPEARHGAALFERVGCATCHVPVLQGAEGPVELYSDLLLHDVARPPREPSDPRDRSALRPESDGPPPDRLFRTAPLWGVRDTAPYLHDGRAATLRDAVLAHDSEAARSRAAFVALAPEEQDALLAFVEGL